MYITDWHRGCSEVAGCRPCRADKRRQDGERPPETTDAKVRRSADVLCRESSADELETILIRGWAPSAMLLNGTKETYRRVYHQDEGWAESPQFVAAP